MSPQCNQNRKHMMNTVVNQHDFTKGAAMLRPLTEISDDTMRKLAPSVYAEEAGPGASSRYQFVRTIDVIDAMRKVGYLVTQARQSMSYTPDGQKYVKHSIRLAQGSHVGANSKLCVGGVVPQVVLTNAHNRTSAFVMEAGLYRLLCGNGLMACAASFAGLRVLHNDPAIYQHIIDGTNLIREVTEATALPMVERMEQTMLTKPLQLEFAEAATLLKFGEVRPDHAEALLVPRREDDAGDSVWQVMNRVQENAVRGGYSAPNRAGHKTTARPILSVDRDRDFNVNLWQLGAKVVDLV
jgi:hypothetical protein